MLRPCARVLSLLPAACLIGLCIAAPVAAQVGGYVVQKRQEAMGNFLLGHFERAFALWLECAEANDLEGERDVAYLYANGLGVAKDMGQAEAWYRRAAARGDARSENSLGVIYSLGLNDAADPGQAADWFRRAAEHGSARAAFSLGQLYDTGRGVPRDFAQAGHWYLAAANQGLAEAQYEMGHAFAHGTGVPRDDISAYTWFELSLLNAKRADTRAAAEKAMATLAKRMPQPEIAVALERADAWRRPRRSVEESNGLDPPRF